MILQTSTQAQAAKKIQRPVAQYNKYDKILIHILKNKQGICAAKVHYWNWFIFIIILYLPLSALKIDIHLWKVYDLYLEVSLHFKISININKY